MKVLVTGATGQLGGAIVREFGETYDVVAPTRRQLDVADGQTVIETVRRLQPSVIINCAAYNDVDRAEDDPVTSLKVNAFAVRLLAEGASGCGATLVHYSTDFVFDGDGDRAYTESDSPRPRSFYAASKLLGEWFAREAPSAYVLRVESLFGGAAFNPVARKSSVDKILSAILADQEVPVIVDRTISPCYVVDVARATRALLERHAAPGIYHCVNSGQCTWDELAEDLARALGRSARLKRVRMDDLHLRAQRPRFCALSNAKLKEAGIEMPSWQDALSRYLSMRELRERCL